MNRKLSALLIFIGLMMFGVTAWVVVDGVRHPTAVSTILITLLCAIGVQAAYISIQAGIRLWARPEASILRTEAHAKSKAAAALEDAETAEKIKLELDAYIAVRARRLEIDRRRAELTSTAELLMQSCKELNRAEQQLGVDSSLLDPETMELLDVLVEDKRRSVPDFYVYGIPVGNALQWAVDVAGDYLEKARLRRLSKIAPEALGETSKDGQQPTQETDDDLGIDNAAPL